MGTRFRDYVRKVEKEAAADGTAAVRELADFRTHFRLAQQLAELRRKRKLSQEALAARSGIHQTEISRIEKGLANPTVRTLAALAEPLRADLWLRPRDGIRLGAGRRSRRAAA
jgi:DNA-binding XRE family transcriptional regulator